MKAVGNRVPLRPVGLRACGLLTPPHMARPQKKHDRVAFYACTSLALGIIVVMWIFSVRSIVGQGVQGTKQAFSDVSDTAGSVRRQTAPDPETVAAVKAGLKSIVTKQTADATVPDPSNASGSSAEASTGSTAEVSTIDAVAQLMKNDVETYGQEPKN